VKITAEHVESLGLYLSPRYDQVAATPDFHRECWTLYCSDEPNVAVAAPRKHAKSTALTQVFGLACVLFRAEDYIIVFSSTEELAIEQLDNIAVELRENEDLIRDLIQQTLPPRSPMHKGDFAFGFGLNHTIKRKQAKDNRKST